MTEPGKYSALERLRDGRRLEIRALKPTDEKDMLASVDRISAQSLYRRFFGGKRHFSESEKAFLLKSISLITWLWSPLQKTPADPASSAAGVTSLCDRKQPGSLSL